jgi:hypothetical protein
MRLVDDEPLLGRGAVKLRALVIPAGNPDKISTADILAAVGPNPVTFSAMLLPEGAAIPPGYVRFGRYIERKPRRPGDGRRPTSASGTAPPTSEPATTPTAIPQPDAVNSDASATVPSGPTYADIEPTMKLWNSLSNPGSTLAALQATSASSLVARSLAQVRWAESPMGATPAPLAAPPTDLSLANSSTANASGFAHSQDGSWQEAQNLTCQEFIAENCKAGILRIFPGQYLDTPVEDVMEVAKQGDRAAQTARKLLMDNRFRK